MPLSPDEQNLINRLNEQFPRSGSISLEQEFRNASIDRQVDQLFTEARNRQQFYDKRLMVPSDAELQYRSTPANPLAEGLAKQPRPNPTPPTTPPRSVDIPSPGRQVSRAAPPPTPRTSGGAGNILDMTAPPPTAAPRQSMPGPNPTPGSKPSGLPGPPGRIAYPVAGAAIDFAFRVGSGQPIGQAAAGSGGTFVGGLIGTVAGSTLGPMGSFVGGMIGSYIGGMLGSALYNGAFPSTAEAPKGLSDPKTGVTPFNGGQSRGVLYSVTYQHTQPDGSLQAPASIGVYGPVFGAVSLFRNPSPGYYEFQLGISASDSAGNSRFYQTAGGAGGFASTNGWKITILSIARADGQPDIGGNPSALPLPQDNRTPDSLSHPGNNSFAPPSANPPLANPRNNSPIAPVPAPNNYAPGGFSSRTGGTPRGDSPNWIPKANLASQPHPNHSPLPVASLPSTSPGGSPASTGAPSAGTTGDPRTSPFTFKPDGSLEIVTPGSPVTTGNPVTNPADRSFPGFQPTILTPNPLTPSNFSASPSLNTATPGALPTTVINQPVPDAYRPTPVVPAPTPTPAPTPATSQPDFDEFRNKLNQLELLIVGATVLLNPIANNTTPEALRDAAAAGTCRTLQPGGCSAPMAQNAEDAARLSADNNNKLNALNTTLQGLDLNLLGVINNKLGPQINNGGISGFIQRAAQATHIDKALNAMNTVLLVHNAAMLSRNLGSTLGELTSQALATIGIKDAEGSPIDINKEIGQQVNTFMENLVGAEVWRGTKTSWNKASSIISSATNIMYTLRSMFDSGREILEWTAENTGKIGNALKKYRLVGEDAYKWMPERVTVQNAFTRRLDRIREGTDSLDDAASSLTGVLGEVQSIQQEYADLQEQKQRFDANIKDLTPKPREENKPVADAVTAARTASKAPADMPQVFRGEGETEDA